jgi:hypothetical protein
MTTYHVERVHRSGRRRPLAEMTCRTDDEAIARTLMVRPHDIVELTRDAKLVWRFER